MANFMIMSDLHEDIHAFDAGPRPDDLDAVLIAGDLGATGEMPNIMLRIRQTMNVPVYAVEGNHDLWGRGRKLRTWRKIREYTDARLLEMSADGPEMRVLRRGDAVVVAGTRVVGATLWTNGKLGDEPPFVLRDQIRERMNDYKRMTVQDETRGLWRKAIPEDLFAEHHKDLTGILKTLDIPFDGPTLVMTHHVPLSELMGPLSDGAGLDLRAAYASDLSNVLMSRVFDAWVYGHSHQHEDIRISTEHGSSRFVSNPRGYVGEAHRYKPGFVLSTNPEPQMSFRP